MELKDLLKIKKPKEGQEESGFIYRKGRCQFQRVQIYEQ